MARNRHQNKRNMRVNYSSYGCPNCGEEIECEVDIGEHFVDISDECPFCKYTLTTEQKDVIYDSVIAGTLGKMTDYATDYLRDR